MKASLGTKLTVGFAAMLGLSSILSLGALASLSALKDRFDAAANQTVKKMELAAEIDTAQAKLFSTQRAIVLYAFSNDAVRRDQFEAEFGVESEKLRTLLAELRPLLKTGRGIELTQSMQSDLDRWLSLYREVIAFANAGKASAALVVTREKVLSIHDALAKAADELNMQQRGFLKTDIEAAA